MLPGPWGCVLDQASTASGDADGVHEAGSARNSVLPVHLLIDGSFLFSGCACGATVSCSGGPILGAVSVCQLLRASHACGSEAVQLNVFFRSLAGVIL